MTPFDLKSEEIVLGSIMIEAKSFQETEGVITENDFYRSSHAVIFRALKILCQRDSPTNVPELVQQLREMGLLEAVGGPATVTDILVGTPTAFYCGYHAKKIAEYSLRRRLADACKEIACVSSDLTIPATEVLDGAERKIFALSSTHVSDSVVHIKDAVRETVNHLDLRHGMTGLTGIASGWHKLDEILLGFQPKDLIIVACRPSVGKTSFALGAARHAALVQKKSVLLFSLEMSTRQLTARFLSAEARIDGQKINGNRMDDNDWSRITSASARLSEASLYLDDTAALKALEIKAKARRIKAQHGKLDLVIIDYLQIMGTPERVESRERAVSEISRNLKAMAKELDCPVIALSQLNRSIESRAEKRPMMSDLRESGAIEQDADVIIFIHRDTMDGAVNEASTAEFIVGKNRNGPRDSVKVSWVGRYTSFENLSGAYSGSIHSGGAISPSGHRDDDD